MWYSETGAGRKMAVIVGGASCWAENRSRTSRACALERVVNGSRGRKKRIGGRGEGERKGSPCGGGTQRWTERKSNLPLATANGRLSIFPALTSAATMSSRAANEIILDTTLRGQPPSSIARRSYHRSMIRRSLHLLFFLLYNRRIWMPININKLKIDVENIGRFFSVRV